MKKSKNDDIPPFVMLDYDLLDSAVWSALSYEAQWIYIELKKQFKRNQGGYDHLILPYSKVSWRMVGNTFFKKINELIEYGLIKRVKSGGLFKNPTVYALSEKWKKKSIKIVDKEGREAIKKGNAKKRTHRNVADNLPNPKKKKESKTGIKR